MQQQIKTANHCILFNVSVIEHFSYFNQLFKQSFLLINTFLKLLFSNNESKELLSTYDILYHHFHLYFQ